MGYARRYLLLGVLVGLVAPAGLAVLGLLGVHQFDPLELFVVMSVGGVLTFATAGWMIGRRDDALRARNEELRLLSARLQALSATDPLTGIPNRRSFDARLLVEIARSGRYGAPLSLVMMDLDHFKALNDQFGHRAGDEVLRQLGCLLDAEKRTGDLVARYGGEEFVALLPHADAPAAAGWAERVRQRIAATRISFEGGTLEITASFGVAEAAAGAAASDLVEAADAALFEAKRAGRNRVVSGASNARVTGGAIAAVKT